MYILVLLLLWIALAFRKIRLLLLCTRAGGHPGRGSILQRCLRANKLCVLSLGGFFNPELGLNYTVCTVPYIRDSIAFWVLAVNLNLQHECPAKFGGACWHPPLSSLLMLDPVYPSRPPGLHARRAPKPKHIEDLQAGASKSFRGSQKTFLWTAIAARSESNAGFGVVGLRISSLMLGSGTSTNSRHACLKAFSMECP